MKTVQLALICMIVGTGCSNDSNSSVASATNVQSGVEQNIETDAIVEQNAPDNNLPETNLPETNLPEINVPDTNLPETDLPETNFPETNLPTNSEPDIGRGLAAIEYAALVFIEEDNGPVGLSISSSARFYSITTPLEGVPVLKPALMIDSCEIGSEASQINALALDVPIDHLLEATGNEILQIATVSAGDSIELNSSAGSYASLIRNSDVDGFQYDLEDGADLRIEIPDTLNVSVAGDDFPSLESQWITPMRIDDTLRTAVRSGAALTWDSATSSDSMQSRIHIYAGFINELTGQTDSFQCELVDDGEFTLPDNIQALYAGGLSANFVDVARYTRSVQLVNDISVVNVFLQRF